MAVYLITILLGAFLLFQVQPIVARYILPWFGGTPAVWTTCMMFFQVGLVAGYLYAHGLRRRFSPRTQAVIHMGVLLVSLVFLPIAPSETWKPSGDENATLRIVMLLLMTVSVPYAVLAATSPLLQNWFTRTHPGRSPYRLYALSNLGSLLGLLTYPFLIEPVLTVDAQTLTWSIAYGAFAVTCGVCAVLLRRTDGRIRATRGVETHADFRLSIEHVLWWLALTGCGSVILLATTNRMCQDVAVIPFLWVLPLSLYLLTFIIAFDREVWYRRKVWVPLFLAALAATVFLLLTETGWTDVEVPIVLQIAVLCAFVFSACMVCHGELVRLKPPPAHLTTFYVMVAVGGAMGGVFVSLIAPRIFSGFWEFHASMLATLILVGVLLSRGLPRWRGLLSRVVWGAACVGLAVVLSSHIRYLQYDATDMRRNFYGVLRVHEYVDDLGYEIRGLMHGKISHGFQFLDEEYRMTPVSYYSELSGVAVAFEIVNGAPYDEERPDSSRTLEIGVVGLGAGCMTPYGRAGDRMTFYEINPEVVAIANSEFTYLRDTPAEIRIVDGDARLSIEREVADGDFTPYGMLFVDAFSGDAIPVHLLTLEAFELYWQRLRPDGMLVIHISNTYLDLSPLVHGLANQSGRQSFLITNEEYEDEGIWAADWVLITGNTAIADKIAKSGYATPWDDVPTIVWSDKFSNLLSVLR